MRLDLLLQVPHVIFGVSELPFQVEDLYLFRLESALGSLLRLRYHRRRPVLMLRITEASAERSPVLLVFRCGNLRSCWLSVLVTFLKFHRL